MAPPITRRAVLRRAGAAGLTLATPVAGVGSGDPGAAQGCTLDALLDRRRMVRRFKPDAVDDAVVRRLIATGTRAPSAGNTQPWDFILVRDVERRTALARAALGQMFVAEAPVVIVPCADPSRARERYGDRAERYATIDTSFASLLILLAVVEEGLGACFVGAFDDAEVKRVLALPADVRALAVMPVGHPAEKPGPQVRRPLTSVVHEERW